MLLILSCENANGENAVQNTSCDFWEEYKLQKTGIFDREVSGKDAFEKLSCQICDRVFF